MKFSSILSPLIIVAASLLTAHAQTTETITTEIPVPDASFESSFGSTNKNPDVASGWVFSVNPGDYYGVNSISSAYNSSGAASGSNYAYLINDNPGVTETITSAASLGTITADTTYTLSVAVGNPSQQDTELYGQPGPVTLSLLANGQAIATQTVANGSVPNGTFDDFTLTYTTPDSGSLIGENLTIQLASLPEHGTAYEPGFDNIQLQELTVETVPEPAISILLLSAGVLCLGFWALRRLQSRAVRAGLAFTAFAFSGLTLSSADPVNVPNFSFESSSGGGGWTTSNSDTISDWTFDAPAGDAYGQLWLTFFTSPGTSAGSESAFIENTSPGEAASLTSATTLGTIAANTTYTLTVAIGNADLNDPSLEQGPLVFDPIADTPSAGVSLALLANGQAFAIAPIPSGLVAGGAFQDFSLSYTTSDSDPIIGDNLSIQLATQPGSNDSQAAAVDNVRLDATAVTNGSSSLDPDGGSDPSTTPEPPAYGMLGLGAAALGWLSRWQRRSRDSVI